MAIISDPRGDVEVDVSGEGATIAFVPGSCSTGAAWRPTIAGLGGGFRCVTTSLPGYGRTAERRTGDGGDMRHAAEAIEAVVGHVGGPVHLVGHSFGGLAALAVALRGEVPLASLTICEAPAIELLRNAGEHALYRDFVEMSAAYFEAFRAGAPEAIAVMIDFYGGAGAFAAMPPRVREYAIETTAVNVRDWADAFSFDITEEMLGAVDVPAHVLWGGASHPAPQRANELLAQAMPRASGAAIGGATHFMITTHADAVADAIRLHVLQ